MKISKILLLSGIIGFLFGNANAGESSLWNTNWDTLSLTQNGPSITGRYIYYTENKLIHGQIRGILDGNLLKGWWKQSDMPCGLDSVWDGPFALLFDEDGKLFIGDWGGCSETLEEMNPSDKTWNGTLLKGHLEME